MNVFISWSGEISKKVASAIRDWLPNVIQVIKPWMSADDIRSGQRWSHTLAETLEESNFGIICLTQENVDKAWINFEAGCLSKSISGGRVVPLLFDLQATDLFGPLAQFQGQSCTREGIQAIIESIYESLDSPTTSRDVVLRSFEAFWPKLGKQLESIRKQSSQVSESIRTDRELLEEILITVRRSGRELPVGARAGGEAMGIQIMWYEDLKLAAETLAEDLSYREYQIERTQNDPRFNHDVKTYDRVQRDLGLTWKVVEYMKVLEKSS